MAAKKQKGSGGSKKKVRKAKYEKSYPVIVADFIRKEEGIRHVQLEVSAYGTTALGVFDCYPLAKIMHELINQGFRLKEELCGEYVIYEDFPAVKVHVCNTEKQDREAISAGRCNHIEAIKIAYEDLKAQAERVQEHEALHSINEALNPKTPEPKRRWWQRKRK